MPSPLHHITASRVLLLGLSFPLISVLLPLPSAFYYNAAPSTLVLSSLEQAMCGGIVERHAYVPQIAYNEYSITFSTVNGKYPTCFTTACSTSSIIRRLTRSWALIRAVRHPVAWFNFDEVLLHCIIFSQRPEYLS